MAKLEQRGLSLEIKNIKALYCEDDNIENDEDYTYEAFDIFLKINNKDIPDVNGTYELCGGNFQYFLDSISNFINDKEYKQIEFEEPNFSFELKYIGDKYCEFIVWCHDESFNNGAYGDTCVGFKFSLTGEELIDFSRQLRNEFNDKEKTLYKDYLGTQRKFYEGE